MLVGSGVGRTATKITVSATRRFSDNWIIEADPP
jgi:hypothetical protein